MEVTQIEVNELYVIYTLNGTISVFKINLNSDFIPYVNTTCFEMSVPNPFDFKGFLEHTFACENTTHCMRCREPRDALAARCPTARGHVLWP